MQGEIRRFKREIVGGFCRRDVIDYIETLAAERNKYREASEKLESEVENLREETARLRDELDAERRRAAEARLEVIDDARRQLSRLETEFVNLRADMFESAERIREEMNRAGEAASAMSSEFDSLGNFIARLRETLDEERAEAGVLADTGGGVGEDD